MNRLSIDQRPLILSMLGTILLLGGLFFTYTSFSPDAERLYQVVAARTPGKVSPGKYMFQCVQQEKCRKAYWQAWKADAVERTGLASAILTGILFSAIGSVWRPDVALQRQWRHHGQKQINLPEEVAQLKKGAAGGVTWPPQAPRQRGAA